MTQLKFEPVYKDKLFYDRYEYCMRFRLPECSVLRELDHNRIDKILDMRIETRRDLANKLASTAKRYGLNNSIPVIHAKRWREITDEMRVHIHAVADFFIGTKVDYKLVISVDLAWVYTNDTRLIKKLKTYPIFAKKYSKAVVNRPKNSILLSDSRYRYRSYFKTLRLTSREKDVLVSFLNQHPDDLRLSPALKSWMEEDYSRTQDYFFVDYQDPSWQTMIALVHPGLIKKTYDIILNK